MYKLYNYSEKNGIVELHVDGYLTEDLYFFMQCEYTNILETNKDKELKFIFNLKNLQLIKYQCVESFKKFYLETVKNENVKIYICLPITIVAKYQIKRILKELKIKYDLIESYEDIKEKYD